MLHMEALRDMQARDPDGGSTEPTEEDYRAFKQWAVATHGEDLWLTYVAGGWDPPDSYA